jgi:hypothetical protein
VPKRWELVLQEFKDLAKGNTGTNQMGCYEDTEQKETSITGSVSWTEPDETEQKLEPWSAQRWSPTQTEVLVADGFEG